MYNFNGPWQIDQHSTKALALDVVSLNFLAYNLISIDFTSCLECSHFGLEVIELGYV